MGVHNTILHYLYCRAEILNDKGKYKLAPMFEVLYSGCLECGGGGKVGKPIGKEIPLLVSTWR
jgi:hypothetical protein